MFEIFDKETCVGKAQILQEGMYYRICCTCEITRGGIHRIVVSDGENEVDLGICVPQGDKFSLTSRIPMRFLKGENRTFVLVRQGEYKPKSEEGPVEKKEVPVESGKSFPNLDELENAYFRNEDEHPVIVIDSSQDQPDSDRNQESP